jgi:hypothetical protein
LALYNVQGDRPRFTTEADVHAYYERNAFADRFYPKGVPFVVMVGFALVTIGFLLQ